MSFFNEIQDQHLTLYNKNIASKTLQLKILVVHVASSKKMHYPYSKLTSPPIQFDCRKLLSVDSSLALPSLPIKVNNCVLLFTTSISKGPPSTD